MQNQNGIVFLPLGLFLGLLITTGPERYSLVYEDADFNLVILEENLTARQCLETRVDDQFCLTERN